MNDYLDPQIETALRDLMSDDPEISSSGSWRLVSFGEAALPALIAALDQSALREDVLRVLCEMEEVAAPAISKILEVSRKDYYYSSEAYLAASSLQKLGKRAIAPLLQSFRTAAEADIDFYRVILPSLRRDQTMSALAKAMAEQDGDYRLRILNYLV